MEYYRDCIEKMGEETLRIGLTGKQVKDLVALLKDSINFRVIHAGKNFWYVGLRVDDGPARVIEEPREQQYLGLVKTQFKCFEPQTCVGVIRKSSAALVLYKDSDSRTEHLRTNGYYDKLRQVINAI